MSTLVPSSLQPSTVCLTHLHLELSFIVLLLLLPFLVLVITAGGLTDHAEEAGVTNVEVVACVELVPPILEWRAHFVVRADPLQAHELGLPSHLQLNSLPLLEAMHYLEVHWHVLRLGQKRLMRKMTLVTCDIINTFYVSCECSSDTSL